MFRGHEKWKIWLFSSNCCLKGRWRGRTERTEAEHAVAFWSSPPTNSDPATSCNLVIVGIVIMTMMVKIVTMMMNWWWWWTVLMRIHQRQPLACTTHQKIMTSWFWAISSTRGVINACLDGFQKAPCLANYFLSDPPLPTHTVVTWICVLYRFVRLLHGFVPVLIQPAHRER